MIPIAIGSGGIQFSALKSASFAAACPEMHSASFTFAESAANKSIMPSKAPFDKLTAFGGTGRATVSFLL